MILITLLISIMISVGLYLFMQRMFIQFLIGMIVLSNAVTLFLTTRSGDPTDKNAPIITGLSESVIDPLPQALTLTAIVIGFAVLAFLVAVIFKQLRTFNTSFWGADDES